MSICRRGLPPSDDLGLPSIWSPPASSSRVQCIETPYPIRGAARIAVERIRKQLVASYELKEPILYTTVSSSTFHFSTFLKDLKYAIRFVGTMILGKSSLDADTASTLYVHKTDKCKKSFTNVKVVPTKNTV